MWSCTRLCLRLVRGPSTRHPASLKWVRRAFHRGCLLRTLGLPKTTTPYLKDRYEEEGEEEEEEEDQGSTYGW